MWTLTLFLGAITPATAAPPEPACSPLTEERFAGELAAAQEALRGAAPEAHKVVMQRLEADLPCLTFVPEPDAWAELLVGAAIVAHATGEDWQKPLWTALTIAPDIDRLVGSSHPIHSWEAPPPPERTGTQVPEGVRVFYDGELIREVPTGEGLHLVQRRDGDGLRTVLLDDEAIPAEWLTLPDLAPGRSDLGWGYFGAVAGLALTQQATPEPGDYLARFLTPGAAVGAFAHGWLRVAGPFGVRFDVGTASLATTPGLDGRLGVGLSFGRVGVHLTAAVRSLPVTEAERQRLVWTAFPALGVTARLLADESLHLGLSAGGLHHVLGGHARVLYRFGDGVWRPHLGLNARSHTGLLVQEGSDRKAATTEAIIAVEGGISWGGRR